MAPRVRPLEPSLERPNSTCIERPNFFKRPIIFKYFSAQKASPLDIVWSEKVTLLLDLGIV